MLFTMSQKCPNPTRGYKYIKKDISLTIAGDYEDS